MRVTLSTAGAISHSCGRVRRMNTIVTDCVPQIFDLHYADGSHLHGFNGVDQIWVSKLAWNFDPAEDCALSEAAASGATAQFAQGWQRSSTVLVYVCGCCVYAAVEPSGGWPSGHGWIVVKVQGSRCQRNAVRVQWRSWLWHPSRVDAGRCSIVSQEVR